MISESLSVCVTVCGTECRCMCGAGKSRDWLCVFVCARLLGLCVCMYPSEYLHEPESTEVHKGVFMPTSVQKRVCICTGLYVSLSFPDCELNIPLFHMYLGQIKVYTNQDVLPIIRIKNQTQISRTKMSLLSHIKRQLAGKF